MHLSTFGTVKEGTILELFKCGTFLQNVVLASFNERRGYTY